MISSSNLFSVIVSRIVIDVFSQYTYEALTIELSRNTNDTFERPEKDNELIDDKKH